MPKQISENKRNMILNGNLSQAILMLAVPVMINSFIQSMYNLTDTFWLGRIGTENQSAITLVSPFQNILNSFGSGITTAGAILISQYLGARKDEQANKMANHICITSLGFSLICALLCWLISPALVTWLGARGVVYEYGLTYLRIVVLDMPFLFMINLFTAVKQAQGDTVKPMLLNLLGIMINLILDPLFLIVFHFGIGGAAFATLIAKIPCALIGLILLTKSNQLIRISFKNFVFDQKMIRAIIKIGLPTAIGGSTMQLRYADHDQKCKCLWLYCNQRLWYWQQNQQSYHNASQWCRFRRFYYSWTKYGSRKHRAGEENLPLFIKNVYLIFTYSGIHFFKTPCFPDYGIILFNRCQSHPSGCRLFIHYCILVLYKRFL